MINNIRMMRENTGSPQRVIRIVGRVFIGESRRDNSRNRFPQNQRRSRSYRVPFYMRARDKTYAYIAYAARRVTHPTRITR